MTLWTTLPRLIKTGYFPILNLDLFPFALLGFTLVFVLLLLHSMKYDHHNYVVITSTHGKHLHLSTNRTFFSILCFTFYPLSPEREDPCPFFDVINKLHLTRSSSSSPPSYCALQYLLEYADVYGDVAI